MPYHVVIKFFDGDDKEVFSEEFDSPQDSAAVAIDARLLRLEIANRRRLEWNKVTATAVKIGEPYA